MGTDGPPLIQVLLFFFQLLQGNLRFLPAMESIFFVKLFYLIAQNKIVLWITISISCTSLFYLIEIFLRIVDASVVLSCLDTEVPVRHSLRRELGKPVLFLPVLQFGKRVLELAVGLTVVLLIIPTVPDGGVVIVLAGKLRHGSVGITDILLELLKLLQILLGVGKSEPSSIAADAVKVMNKGIDLRTETAAGVLSVAAVPLFIIVGETAHCSIEPLCPV